MADISNEKWVDLLKSGGAGTFFEAYPEDSELAEKINELFPKAGIVPAEQVKRDRQRYYLRPQRGDETVEQEASPSKYVIRNKANQLNVQEAFAENL